MTTRITIPRDLSPVFAAQVSEHARLTNDALDHLTAQVNALAQKVARQNGKKSDSPGSTPPPSQMLGPATLGAAGSPQLAGVPTGTALPGPGDPLTQDQALFLVVDSLTVPTTFALWRYWAGPLNKWIQIPLSGGGGGGLTSVGLGVPADIFNTTNNPLTSNGVITVSEVTQGANTFWAGPVAPPAANPIFRKLVGTDFPLGATQAQSSIPSAPIVRDVSIAGEGTLFGFVTAPDTGLGSHINKVGAMFKVNAFGVMNVGGNVSITFRLRTLAGNLELAQWRLSPGPIPYNLNSVWMIDADCFVTTAGATGQIECHGKLYTSPVGGVGGIQDADMTTLDIHFVPITPVGPIDLTTQQIINWTADVTFTSSGTISQRYSRVIYLN